VRAFASLTVAAILFGCGGPSYRFDPAPAPAWITDEPSGASARSIEAVGMAPVTTAVQRDVELATRDAKNRVAQMFESQVAARASDWSLAVSGGAADADRTVASSSVEVRSNVNVEDVTIDATYRDEETRSQYVKITVDRPAWTRRLRQRLADGLDQVETKTAAAQAALSTRKPLAAYREMLAANALGQKIEPDIVVIDLLDARAGVRKKLVALKGEIDDIGKRLRADVAFAIDIRGGNARTNAKLTGNLRDFLGGYGFAVGGGGDTVTLEVELGQRFVSSEQVATRTEYVHAATGSLRAIDADGSEIAELGFTLTGDRYTERDVARAAARQKALQLAADTVASRFRSAFRSLFEQ
jgi:hypothetical protein